MSGPAGPPSSGRPLDRPEDEKKDYLEDAKDSDYKLGAGAWAPYALVPALLAIGDELRGIRLALERGRVES